MQIHIKKIGQGKPLVFFHGWGFDHRVWLNLAESIKDQFTLFLVDLPGFGASESLDWERFKQAMAVQLPEKYSLIGWSMGGLYAMRLAIEQPERLDRLLVITASPRFIEDKGWPGVKLSVFQNFFQALQHSRTRVLQEFVSLQTHNRYAFEGALPSLEGLENGLKVLLDWDLRIPLKTLKKPASFLFGRLDRIVAAKTLDAMNTGYPDFSFTMFKKAAHMPFLSHKEEFINFLEEFLSN